MQISRDSKYDRSKFFPLSVLIIELCRKGEKRKVRTVYCEYPEERRDLNRSIERIMDKEISFFATNDASFIVDN